MWCDLHSIDLRHVRKVREETDPLELARATLMEPCLLPCLDNALVLWVVQMQHCESLETRPQRKQLSGLIVLHLEKERRLRGMEADLDYLKFEVPSSRRISFLIKRGAYILNVSMYKVRIRQIGTAHHFCARHCPGPEHEGSPPSWSEHGMHSGKDSQYAGQQRIISGRIHMYVMCASHICLQV